MHTHCDVSVYCLILEVGFVYLVLIIASFRFEDEDENEDQVQLLLIVCMLKSVTVMAWQCCCNQLRRPGLVEDEKVLRCRCGEKRVLPPRPRLCLRLRPESKALYYHGRYLSLSIKVVSTQVESMREVAGSAAAILTQPHSQALF